MAGSNDYGFGISFLPNGDSRYQRPGQGGGTSSTAPVQDAIKILSMRMPRMVGANPLAPLGLLQGAGGRGLPEGLIQMLMRAMGQGPPTGAAGPGMGGVGITGAPSPYAQGMGPAPASPFGEGAPPVHVTPGVGGPGGPPSEGGLPPPENPLSSPIDAGRTPWDMARQQRGRMSQVVY